MTDRVALAAPVECDMCGRELTTKKSRARGRGPTCQRKLDRAPMLPGIETVPVLGGLL